MPVRGRPVRGTVLLVGSGGGVVGGGGAGRLLPIFRRASRIVVLVFALLTTTATFAGAWCGFQHPEDCLFVLRRTAGSDERAIVFKDSNGTVSGALALTSPTSFGFYVGAGVEASNRVLEADAAGDRIVTAQTATGEVEVFGAGRWHLLRRSGSAGEEGKGAQPAELVLQLAGGSAASPQAVDHCDNMPVGSVLFQSRSSPKGSAGIRTLAMSESGAAGSHVGGQLSLTTSALDRIIIRSSGTVEIETSTESEGTDSGALATAGGVRVMQNVNFGGSLAVGGDLGAREIVMVGKRTFFGKSVVVGQGADLGGGGIRCEGGGSITGVTSLAVEGKASVSGSLAVGADLEVGRDVRISGRLLLGSHEQLTRVVDGGAALTTAGGIFVAQRAHFGGPVEASSLDAMMHGLTLAGGSIDGATSVEVDGRVVVGGLSVSAGGMGVEGPARAEGNLVVGSALVTRGGIGVSGSAVLDAGLHVGPRESDGIPSVVVSSDVGSSHPALIVVVEEESREEEQEEKGGGGESKKGRDAESLSKGVSFEAFDGKGFASMANITADERSGIAISVAGGTDRPALSVGMDGNVHMASAEEAALSLAGGVAIAGNLKVGGRLLPAAALEIEGALDVGAGVHVGSGVNARGDLTIASGGTFKCGASTEITHPDYVFDDAYPLLSTAALREFLRDHHHLPNISYTRKSLNSSEHAEQGNQQLDLIKFPIELLEKIEETYLYHFDLEERLQALEEGVLVRAGTESGEEVLAVEAEKELLAAETLLSATFEAETNRHR